MLHRMLSTFVALLIFTCILSFLATTNFVSNHRSWRLPFQRANSSISNNGDEAISTGYPHPILVQDLNSRFLPKDSIPHHKSPKKSRRLIFIGDIHGCLEELKGLLKKVKYDKRKDHIIALGDMINKGPDSAAVIDYLRHHEASCVRGNHEDRILHLRYSMLAELELAANVSSLGPSVMKDEPRDRRLAKSLTHHQLKYLESCPVILRIGHLKSVGEMVAVHAGLVPGIALEKQDPQAVMTMRTINHKTHQPSADHEQEGYSPWTVLWNQHQKHINALSGQNTDRSLKKLSHRTPTVVFYGHDSRNGLQLRTYTKGLDTGCVRGGQLTALVLSDGGVQEIVQLDCNDNRG